MKGKTKKFACYMLVFSLLITSITTAYVNKPTPVKGGEIVLTYTAYEVMLAIMAGLGLSVADYGIQTSQDDLENAKAFYESCQHWEEVDKEYLNKAIETAQTTGQVVIDKASGVWEKLKAEFGELASKIKSVNKQNNNIITEENSSQYLISSGKSNEFYKYLTYLLGSNVPLNGTNTQDCYINTNCYYVLVNGSNNYTYLLHSYTIGEFNSMINSLSSGYINIWDAVYFYFNNNNKANWSSAYGSAASKSTGISLNSIVSYKILDNLSMQDAISLQNLGYSGDIAYKDNYDIVYHPPTVGDVTHAYDIITPENTAEKDEDGTYKIGGAYVIDVANPVTYPVDLTDGQTIPDEKSEIGTIPITDIVKVNEKTDTGEDNKTEETENTGGSTKPIVPDVSSGDIPDMAVLKTLFPFCIPFDIADSIKLMQADAVAPKWTIKINIPIGKKTIPFEFTIDMSILDEQVKIFRDGQVVIFIIGLAFATTKVIKWGASEE